MLAAFLEVFFINFCALKIDQKRLNPLNKMQVLQFFSKFYVSSFAHLIRIKKVYMTFLPQC